MLDIEKIIELAPSLKVSDIHIVAGLPLKGRIDGEIRTIHEDILSSEDTFMLAKQIAGEEVESISKIGEIDLARTFLNNTRTRINIFKRRGYFSIAIRILADKIPEIEDLGLPKIVSKLPTLPNGIVLITGETGSGKSTTLAAILNRINHTRNDHIITLEDPIEYIYEADKCIINQREIGSDTLSYADGLRAILREDPDVILIGEMRDLDTIEAALTAAETGHLVFATLHTNSASGAIDRIISVFPEGKQKQIRLQLSTTLRYVIAQQLLPKKDGGRVAALEVMAVNNAIANLIREGKTPQIDSFITMGSSEGSINLDNALMNLLLDGKITKEVALEHARDIDHFKRLR